MIASCRDAFPAGARPRIDTELRELIERMVKENRWGAPRIHGELLKLGFRVSGHLSRLLREFLAYYHDDRTHLSIGKDPPTRRAVSSRPSATAEVVSLSRIGGLHHRYEWAEAA